MANHSHNRFPHTDLEVYQVGGAVRDQLLEFPHTETDWVVIGATAQDMLARGFKQVGRDFPVFLHPDTQEEYALARTERKSGHGHHAFDLHASPEVTLVEDLLRRDLTINAMAMDASGGVIDPYRGKVDLKDRVLRHVSPAFVEDPLRVLRVARFAARYHHLGFRIAPETLALMSDIVFQGELEYLSPERIWNETVRALNTESPSVFFRVLMSCNAAELLFPGLNNESLSLLEQATGLVSQSMQRWGVVMTPLPQGNIEAIATSLKMPNLYHEFGRQTSRWLKVVDLNSGESVFNILVSMQALKKPDTFQAFIETVAALDGVIAEEHPGAQLLNRARDEFADVRSADFVTQGLQGKALGDAIRAERIRRIERLIASGQQDG